MYKTCKVFAHHFLLFPFFPIHTQNMSFTFSNPWKRSVGKRIWQKHALFLCTYAWHTSIPTSAWTLWLWWCQSYSFSPSQSLLCVVASARGYFFPRLNCRHGQIGVIKCLLVCKLCWQRSFHDLPERGAQSDCSDDYQYLRTCLERLHESDFGYLYKSR